MLLGVASIWDDRKGLDDYFALSKVLPSDYLIMMVGLDENATPTILDNIIPTKSTHDPEKMALIYSIADILLSLSYGETFGMTIAETNACGSPAIVYANTAQPEVVKNGIGWVVKTGDIKSYTDAHRFCEERGAHSWE